MDGNSVTATKRCNKCFETKAVSQFHLNGAKGRRAECRSCTSKLRPSRRKHPIATPSERFWSKVDRNGPIPAHVHELGQCWEWTAYRTPLGYGGFKAIGENRCAFAHRVSWELTVGVIPEGLCVLHKCDNPPCVNPSHLFLGTRTENMDDKVRKSRQHRGDRHPQAVLREDQIATLFAMRASGNSQRKIAEACGVPERQVNSVLCGKTWKHAPRDPADEAVVRSMIELGGRIYGQFPRKRPRRI